MIADRSVLNSHLPLSGLPTLRLDDLERMAITEALRATGGNRVRAARLLGIHVRTLHRKLVAMPALAELRGGMNQDA